MINPNLHEFYIKWLNKKVMFAYKNYLSLYLIERVRFLVVIHNGGGSVIARRATLQQLSIGSGLQLTKIIEQAVS